VNGDGYSDVIVGAENYGAGQGTEGVAFVFHGSASGIADGNPVSAATQLEANQSNALLGGSVAGAGDVNGDGYSDVIVGARLYDAGQSDEGAGVRVSGHRVGNRRRQSGHGRRAARIESGHLAVRVQRVGRRRHQRRRLRGRDRGRLSV
jgi:hypothetical protein